MPIPVTAVTSGPGRTAPSPQTARRALPPTAGVDPPSSTTELVELARAGHQPAWDELMRRYGRLVYSIARRHRLSGAECDDVAQATWLRLVQSIGSIRDPERCGDWLASVARNESLRVITRERRAQPMADPFESLDAPSHSDPAGNPAQVAESNDEMRQVSAALATLRPSEQELLRLVLRDPQPTYAEINAATGIPVASIGPTRTRCLRRLRAALEAGGFDAEGRTRQLSDSTCPDVVTAGV
ncbi:MAG: hypothetical protein JWP82_909 [Humibacillus sp.]|nr:hypothetical protein [Humibacillus sp.]